MDVERLLMEHQELRDLLEQREIFWVNPDIEDRMEPLIDQWAVDQAVERIRKAIPYMEAIFSDGDAKAEDVESPLVESHMIPEKLARRLGYGMEGKIYLKCDNLLPVTGSSLDRVWLFEILRFAEDVAEDSGMYVGEDYRVFEEKRYTDLFSQYSVVIGSDDRLGRAAATFAERLGFKVTLLVEDEAYEEAVRTESRNLRVKKWGTDHGRTKEKILKEKDSDPFVLYLWESDPKAISLVIIANMRMIVDQMKEEDITVDGRHPLFLILPRGGSIDPGPLAYYVREVFGKNVHCFVGECTEKPDMAYGLISGLSQEQDLRHFSEAAGQDFPDAGLIKSTEDVKQMSKSSLDGVFTVSPESRRVWTDIMTRETGRKAGEADGVCPEGVLRIQKAYAYLMKNELNGKMENATFILWLAGV